MPVATPIAATPDQLALVSYNDDGLVPAIVQEHGTGQVLMMAWMNEESLVETLAVGTDRLLVPQPTGAVAQGGHLGGASMGP